MMLMISFNTVDYRSSIQPVMKVIKFAAYNTKYFFCEKETSQKRSAKGRKMNTLPTTERKQKTVQ